MFTEFTQLITFNNKAQVFLDVARELPQNYTITEEIWRATLNVDAIAKSSQVGQPTLVRCHDCGVWFYATKLHSGNVHSLRKCVAVLPAKMIVPSSSERYASLVEDC